MATASASVQFEGSIVKPVYNSMVSAASAIKRFTTSSEGVPSGKFILSRTDAGVTLAKTVTPIRMLWKTGKNKRFKANSTK